MNTIMKNVLVKVLAGDYKNKNVGKAERAFSVASGAMMLMSGLKGARRSPAGALLSAAAGSFLLYRGISGHCKVNELIGRNSADETQTNKALVIKEKIVVNKPRNEVYAYWRNLENLPKFMTHLKTVKEYDAVNSHWEARIPGGLGSLEWDAEIVFELEHEALAWKSAKYATVENSGDVAFTETPGGETIIYVKISYTPPVGEIGMAVTSFFNNNFEEMIRQDLLRFKEILEWEPKLHGAEYKNN